MDLNHIELPPVTLVDFYSSSLVEFNDSQKNKKTSHPETPDIEKKLTLETKPDKWIALGHNKKNILIILKNKEVVHLTDADLNFLSGILSACKLTVADVAILNLNNYPSASYKEIITHFKSKTVFLFGIDPVTFGLPINFPEFQPQIFDKISFLFSPPLKELETDKVLKSKLWVCLRRIFGI